MKRRMFLLRRVAIFFALLILLSWSQPGKPGRDFYQLTVYHYSNEGQEKTLDNYLQHALVPALHRMNIKQVGIFKNTTNDTALYKSLYVLIPVRSLDMITGIPAKLDADKDYQSKGAGYINTVYTLPPYTRMEIILLQAFSLAPQLEATALKGEKKDRVYELRSYESASEKIFKNKVKMFNEGDEIGLFKRLNFNAIFYGEVIAGCKMPNLRYMTSFENMTERDAHWKSFSADPFWKKLSALPEYQHNVSHIDIDLLRPVEYSDL